MERNQIVREPAWPTPKQVAPNKTYGNEILTFTKTILILLILFELGWLGLRSFQYFNQKKAAEKKIQEQIQAKEQEAQTYLQEIPEPSISQGFLDYYASEGGSTK